MIPILGNEINDTFFIGQRRQRILRCILVLDYVGDVDSEVTLIVALDKLNQVTQFDTNFLQFIQCEIIPEIRIGHLIDEANFSLYLLNGSLGLQRPGNLGYAQHALTCLVVREYLCKLYVENENIEAQG